MSADHAARIAATPSGLSTGRAGLAGGPTRSASGPSRLASQASFAGDATGFVTGEAVHLDVRFARLGSRMLARLIDVVVQLMLVYALSIVLNLLALLLAVWGLVALDGALFGIVQIAMLVIVFIGYPVLMETVTRGRTLGKLVVGLRVVRDDGGPVTFRHALTRGLVGAAIEWPGFVGAPVTWLASISTMIASRTSKRIGDHAAGTVVIHERTPAAWGWVPRMPPALAEWAITLDLAGLDDELALAVRHFLARNREIREPARTQLGQRLAREVAAVTHPPPPAATPGWAYLAAVHAERHRRAVRQLVAVRSRAATVWPDLAAVVAPPLPGPRAERRAARVPPNAGSPVIGETVTPRPPHFTQ